jgi:hypothetical protein
VQQRAAPNNPKGQSIMQITWSAKNNSSYLNGSRTAPTILAAVRAARSYVRGELYGEGVITIFVNGYPVREDERSIFTGFRWVSSKL